VGKKPYSKPYGRNRIEDSMQEPWECMGKVDDTQLNQLMKSYRIWVRGNIYTMFWKVKALHSTQHLAWRVLLNIVTTRQNLSLREVVFGDDTCVMCGEMVETESFILHML